VRINELFKIMFPGDWGTGQTLSLGCHIYRVSRVRVTLTVMVRVSRISVMVSVRDSVK